MTGRILADLGADVVKVEPPEGDPLRRRGPFHPDGRSLRFEAWNAGKTSIVVCGADDPTLDALLRTADVVIDTPGHAGAWLLDPGRAPQAVWVSVTPLGLSGPRSHWVATDLGAIAASGNMYSHRRPRAAAGAVHRADGLRPHRSRGGASPRCPGLASGARSGSTSRWRRP